MSAQNVGAVVVKDFGRLIGVLTERDMLRAMAARVHTSDARVRQWMTENPVTAPPDMTFEEASKIMLDKGFRHLPVVDGETILGIVSLRRIMGGRRRGAEAAEPLGAGAETTPFVSAFAAAETLMPRFLSCATSFAFARTLPRSLILRRVLAEEREPALARVLRPADPAERVEVLQRRLAVRRAPVRRLRARRGDLLRLRGLRDRRDAGGAVANTAVTFLPYAPVSVAAISATAARIPAYSTATTPIVRPARRSVNLTRSSGGATRCRPRVAGRGFARAAGRSAARAATSASSSSGMPRSRRRSKPPSRASSSTRAAGIGDAERSAEGGDRVRHGRLVEAKRRGEAEGVHRAVREAVASAERLRHRVREEEPALGERHARVHGALEQPRTRVEVAPVVGDDAGATSRSARAPIDASSHGPA